MLEHKSNSFVVRELRVIDQEKVLCEKVFISKAIKDAVYIWVKSDDDGLICNFHQLNAPRL